MSFWKNKIKMYLNLKLHNNSTETVLLQIFHIVFNLVLQINKQTDDSTLLDIQTRLSDKKKREIADCLNDTLTNFCGQKFAKTTLPSKQQPWTWNPSKRKSRQSDSNTADLVFNCT
jgi:hypothetical protein